MTDGNAMPAPGQPAPDPADWSPVCSDRMALYPAVMPEFSRFGASMLGISVDGIWCHRAFVADRDGAIAVKRWLGPIPQASSARSYLSPPSVNPGADGILAALEGLHQRGRVDRIRRDFIGGVRSGVNGTPTSFINGIRHDQGYTLAELLLAVDEAANNR